MITKWEVTVSKGKKMPGGQEMELYLIKKIVEFNEGGVDVFVHEVKVRFSECDGLGHVNNAKYYTYMEEAREDIFRLFNPSLRLETWNLIIVSTRCDYLHQVGYAEILKVYTWIGRMGKSSFDVEHAIANERGEWVARGQGVMIGYDYNAQKSEPVPGEIARVLAEHREAPVGAPDLRSWASR